MGIRATMIGEDISIEWPKWLFDKYDFLTNEFGMLQTKFEVKAIKYYEKDGVFDDLLKAFKDCSEDFIDYYKLVVLEETGRVVRVVLSIYDGVVFEEIADPRYQN